MYCFRKTSHGVICGGAFICLFLLVYISFDYINPRKTYLSSLNKDGTFNEYQPLQRNDKKRQLAYLKISKTGSTTTSIMFIRFGFKHNLTMCYPYSAQLNDTGQQYLLSKKVHFDMFVAHTNYSHYFFTHIIKDPAIVSVIRDPEQRLISHGYWFFRKKANAMPAQKFVNNIAMHSDKYNAQNVMSRFFRIPDSANKNGTELKEILQKLNSDFLLVLIIERYNESLVLLKRLLNWDISDIVYKPARTGYHQPLLMDDAPKQVFLQTNKMDYELYDFFLNELEKKIKKEGMDFQEEVLQFKYVLNQVGLFCDRMGKDATTSYHIPSSKWDPSFTLNRKDCTDMASDRLNNLVTPNFTIII